MSLSYEFLTARADEATLEAKNAKLENVRDRASRSAAAWRDMADRARKMERNREKIAAQRQLLQTAESAPFEG